MMVSTRSRSEARTVKAMPFQWSTKTSDGTSSSEYAPNARWASSNSKVCRFWTVLKNSASGSGSAPTKVSTARKASRDPNSITGKTGVESRPKSGHNSCSSFGSTCRSTTMCHESRGSIPNSFSRVETCSRDQPARNPRDSDPSWHSKPNASSTSPKRWRVRSERRRKGSTNSV